MRSSARLNSTDSALQGRAEAKVNRARANVMLRKQPAIWDCRAKAGTGNQFRTCGEIGACPRFCRPRLYATVFRTHLTGTPLMVSGSLPDRPHSFAREPVCWNRLVYPALVALSGS